MHKDALYWFLTKALDWLLWGGELMNGENLPTHTEYPVVFVSNHAAALGPIAVISSLPVRVHPWVISDMLEWDKAAAYLCKDFVEPQLHISPPFSMRISKLISQASVRLLRALEGIPVWHGEKLFETYRISLQSLVRGKSILVFPENPALPMNEWFLMTPFEKSIARLGELYFEQTKRILPFFPLAIHPAERKMNIGKPILYNPHNDPVRERIRIKDVIEAIIHDLYLNITLENHAGIPLPH